MTATPDTARLSDAALAALLREIEGGSTDTNVVLSASALDDLPDNAGPRHLTQEPIALMVGAIVLVHGRENIGKSVLTTSLGVTVAHAGFRALLLVGEGDKENTRDVTDQRRRDDDA